MNDARDTRNIADVITEIGDLTETIPGIPPLGSVVNEILSPLYVDVAQAIERADEPMVPRLRNALTSGNAASL